MLLIKRECRLCDFLLAKAACNLTIPTPNVFTKGKKTIQYNTIARLFQHHSNIFLPKARKRDASPRGWSPQVFPSAPARQHTKGTKPNYFKEFVEISIILWPSGVGQPGRPNREELRDHQQLLHVPRVSFWEGPGRWQQCEPWWGWWWLVTQLYKPNAVFPPWWN